MNLQFSKRIKKFMEKIYIFFGSYEMKIPILLNLNIGYLTCCIIQTVEAIGRSLHAETIRLLFREFWLLSSEMAAISLLNPKAEFARAAQALAVNISAAKGIQDVMRTNLGPKGTMKMYVYLFSRANLTIYHLFNKLKWSIQIMSIKLRKLFCISYFPLLFACYIKTLQLSILSLLGKIDMSVKSLVDKERSINQTIIDRMI